jgi:hypothetical protein
MVIEMNNSGSVDIANRWSVGGRTHHVDVRNYFLRELKDQGLLVIQHFAGESNDADIYTKNVTSAVFDRHEPLYVGHDKYLNDRDSSGEAVGEQNRPNLEEGKNNNALHLVGPSKTENPNIPKIGTQHSPNDVTVE